MNYKELAKKLGVGVIICLVSLLTYKFIAWNFWKVKDAVVLGKKTLKEPGAVNLALLRNGDTLFQKSFAFNPEGNYYLIDDFDIAPYTGADLKFSLSVEINHRKVEPVILRRFDTFYIMVCERRYFVFTGKNFPIETLAQFEQSIPSIIESLESSAGPGEK